MTEADLKSLVEQLEDCTLPLDQFHHRQHLAVASYYVATSTPAEALARMRSALKRYVAFHNKADRYHETVTRFWIAMIATHTTRPAAALAEEVIAACATTDLIHRYYLQATLDSAAARAGWVAPDLAPLPPAAQEVVDSFAQLP